MSFIYVCTYDIDQDAPDTPPKAAKDRQGAAETAGYTILRSLEKVDGVICEHNDQNQCTRDSCWVLIFEVPD